MLTLNTAQKIFDVYYQGKIISFEKQASGITGGVFEINNKLILKLHVDKTDPLRADRNAFTCKILEKNNIKAPLLIAIDKSKKIAWEDYVLTTKLKGENLRNVWKNLDVERQRQIFFEYGRLMARLHQIKMEKFGDPADKNHQFSRWYDCFMARFSKNYDYINKNKIIPKNILKKIKDFFTENDELLHIKTSPVFVHNDFQAKNIKYLDGNLNGIFDFDECLGAHNEFEFIKTCLPFKKEKIWLDEILRGYKTVGLLSKDFPQRIKLYELNFCLKILVFSHANNLIFRPVKNKFLWAIDKILKEDWRFFEEFEEKYN